MNIAKFSVKNSLLVNLLSVLLIIAGLFALSQLNREAFPVFSFDIVLVATVYPGSPAPEIEKLITIPLEKELKGVDGIDEMYSESQENSSVIVIQMDPDSKKPDKIIRDIQRAVDRVKDLPKDAEDPEVTELSTREVPVIEVSLSGNLSEAELQRYAEILEGRLDEIEGMAKVQRRGWRDPEIWVEVEPEELARYYVSPGEIMESLRRKNINLPGGKLRTGDEEVNIRILGEFKTPREVEEVIIRANDVGNWLRIKDLARVIPSFEDEDTLYRTEGSRAIRLILVKKEEGDAIQLVDQAREIIEEFKETAPSELEIVLVNDLSFYIRRRLGVLTSNGLIGIILVLVSLFLFLSRPVAFFTALGLPIAFLTTFAIMAYFGISINLITLFGLILVLGMIVDDGIIIAENVYRHIEDGMSPREAAIVGTGEVIKPVTATILTTIAAFSPLLFMSGIMGKFIRGIPTVVIVALLASMLEAFIILPSHLADFVRPPKKDRAGRIRSKKDARWYRAFLGGYTRLITGAVRFRYLVCLLFVGILAGCLALAFSPLMKLILFPQVGIEQFFIRAEGEVGMALETTRDRIEPIEEMVAALPAEELETYVTTIGAMENDANDPFGVYGSHVAQVHVYLTPDDDRARSADEIIEGLREKASTMGQFKKISFEKIRHGPPVGKAVAARVKGDDFAVSRGIGDQIEEYLKTIPGVIDIGNDYGPGKDEVEIVIDEEKAALAGLSVSTIATSIRNAIRGGIATTIRPDKAEEEVDVLVRYPPGERNRLDVFETLRIPNRFGKLIPLSRIATLDRRPGISSIKHLEGKRVISVTAGVDETITTSRQANLDLARRFKDIPDRHLGYTLEAGGEWEETQKSMSSLLRSFIIAFFLVFMILAANFRSLVQPLIVMLAIPFGFIGVIIGFYVHGLPLSFMALLGVVGLSGVVVNDSIVLVEFINNLRRAGRDRRSSIIRACRLRLRPVVLTTITTVLGLVSVAYMIGGGDPFIRPAAMAIVWGLSFATFLTLVLIPCVYAIMDDIILRIFHHGTVRGEDRKWSRD
jgi:multidrug efflux pump subunit AcrB